MSIATPQTQTEFDDLIRLFTSTVRGTKKIKENFAFVGIQKFGHEWLEIQSKKTISYTMKWLPDDPSGDGLCAELFINHQLAGLNDVPCVNFYRNFLCEKVCALLKNFKTSEFNFNDFFTLADIAPPITTQAPYQPPVNHCAELESENSELRDRIANLEREISEM